ncbi:hypothetical protein FP026_08200 [Rhizobium tropici]|uniref:CHRD domain-containing protein n=2 Tax=Rhizobium tropici TaxID=398 RepID=A0A5B0W806_RHITR|nr:hypothetical protein FP026_08200 [Rhizobium tropici]
MFTADPSSAESYKAHLTALNPGKIGTSAEGDATFKIVGDNLEVHIKMKGVPANIEHWEHFHGFPDGRNATCATSAEDKNKDGYIDLGETEPVMGTTMVPFNDKPEEMNIPTHTYPQADASGSYEYTKIVPLKALQEKFGETYKGGSIDLDKRVVMVHGVPEKHALPASVGSLGPIPSHVTLPIACGKIEKVTN